MPDPSHHQLAYASFNQADGGSRHSFGIYVEDLEASTTTEWLAPTTDTWGAPSITNPVISPDATKIAYVYNLNSIHVIDLATDADFAVAIGEYPQWTPDSKALIFDQKSGAYGLTHQLFYAPPVASSTPIAIPNGTSAGYVHVSPDGKQLSFIDYSNVTPSGGTTFLGVMNVDGTNRHSLGVQGYPAAWSPNSTQLAFAEDDPAGPGGNTRISVINPDGTGHIMLNTHPAGITSGHTEDPVWSTDGSKIFFSQPGTSNQYDNDIFSIAPNDTGLTDVKPDTLNDTTPSVSGPETPLAAVPTFPNAPIATADTSTSVQVSWDAVSGATSYTVTLQPGAHTTTVAGTSTSLTGLAPGTSYSASVAASNAVGTGLPSATTPVSTPASLPAAPTGLTAKAQSTSALVSWTAPNDGGAPLTGYTITTDPGGATTSAPGSATSATVSGLSNGGKYSFTVTASNANGPGPTSQPSPTITIDTTPPAVTVKALPLVVTAATSTVGYVATDASTGVASYDVRYRTATPTSGFSSYASPSGFLNRTSTSASVTLAAGATICWSVRARDHAGNVSAWTADHCTARVVDDRSLSIKTTGWARITSSAFLSGTATRARATSAKLASASWGRGRVRVVVETCSTCGAVRVYAGSTYLGTLSTYASTTHYRVVLSLSAASAGGSIRIVTTSSKQVFIDAVGLQRY